MTYIFNRVLSRGWSKGPSPLQGPWFLGQVISDGSGWGVRLIVPGIISILILHQVADVLQLAHYLYTRGPGNPLHVGFLCLHHVRRRCPSFFSVLSTKVLHTKCTVRVFKKLYAFKYVYNYGMFICSIPIGQIFII